MAKLRELMGRILFLLRRGRFDDELSEEMRFHIELMTRQNAAAGMSEAEARREALGRFGNKTLMQEKSREIWVYGTLQALVQDLSYGLRLMRRAPGFTIVAVVSLALGIGANTAIFSVVDSLMLRMLPVRDPGRLVEVSVADYKIGDVSVSSFSYPAYTRLRDNNDVFDGLMATGGGGRQTIAFDGQDKGSHDNAGARQAGQIETIKLALVSGNYFSTLGVNPILGRTIAPDDDKAGSAQAVAVISYNYWKRRWALDPAVIGRTFTVGGTSLSVIGVAAPAFFGTEVGESTDIFMPLTMQPALTRGNSNLESFGTLWLTLMGRLKAGITEAQVTADLNTTYRRVLEERAATMTDARIPADGQAVIRDEYLRQHVAVSPGGRGASTLRENFSKPLAILMGIVGMVLLTACANIANLMLARGAARRREISVRLALGAARSRLVRQLLTESLMLAAMGGALGLLVAGWGSQALLSLVSKETSRVSLDVHLDIRILAFTTGVTLLTGVLSGLAPALGATRLNLTPALNDRARVAGSRGRLGKALVAGQVMLSLLLLIGAGLFVHSFKKLAGRDLGFDRAGVWQVSWDTYSTGYKDDRLANMFNAITDRISSLPGVLSVSLSSTGLLSNSIGFGPIAVEDEAGPVDESMNCHFDKVGANFFETVGMPILRGRGFGPQDVANAPLVAIINEEAARRYFDGADPIGKRFYTDPERKGDLIEVVGIAKNAMYYDERDSVPPMVYTPFIQGYHPDKKPANPKATALGGLNNLEVRAVGATAGLGASVRNEIHSIDSNLSIDSIAELGELAGESLIQDRAIAMLSSFFGLLALGLASVGLYGVMSYSVNRRTAEVGIRLALGARPGRVQWLIMRETLLLLITGMAGGLVAAVALTRLVSSLLFGLSAMDPASIVLATVALSGASVLAGYLPARRASRVDPMSALRCE
jgi:predicted permease